MMNNAGHTVARSNSFVHEARLGDIRLKPGDVMRRSVGRPVRPVGSTR
jgi:hypothetical protein